MTLQDIEDVKNEAQRFSQKLLAFVTVLKEKNVKPDDTWLVLKERASLKRAALDLKNELTKLNK